jgi:hypothetical protein
MIDNRTSEQKFEDRCFYNRQNKNVGFGTIETTVYADKDDKDVKFVDTSTITSKINLKNMKKTNKKVINQNYYEKNKLIISERNKQNRIRKQRVDKFHFYGFWLLLTAVLVDTFINQIL